MENTEFFKTMKIKVLEKNNELILLGLVIGTFGNASAKEGSPMLIKPSGVDLSSISEMIFLKLKLIQENYFLGKDLPQIHLHTWSYIDPFLNLVELLIPTLPMLQRGRRLLTQFLALVRHMLITGEEKCL